MSGKILIEFDDSEVRCIEALAKSLDMTPIVVPHVLASLAGELSEVILRQPMDKREEFRRSLERFLFRSSHDASGCADLIGQTISEHSQQMSNEPEADSVQEGTSDIVDDEELSKISDELMIRKAELYRRLAR